MVKRNYQYKLKILFLINFIYLNETMTLPLEDNGSLRIKVKRDLDAIATEELNKEADLYHRILSDTGIGNREKLHLASINENEFNYGEEGVLHWYSVSRYDKLYLLGLTQNKLISFCGPQSSTNESIDALLQSKKVLEDIPSKPIAASLVDWWNSTSYKTEVISVIAFDSPRKDIVWYRFDGAVLERLFSWDHHKPINYLKVIPLGSQYKLLIGNKDDLSLDIYNIMLEGLTENKYSHSKKKSYFVLSQTIPLQTEIWSLVTNNLGDTVYIFIAYGKINTIELYKAITNENPLVNSNFDYHRNITHVGVKDLSTFVTSGQSYLAVSGSNPAIYEIKSNGSLVNDLKTELGYVDKFLPLKTHNYRDDVLLVVLERNVTTIKFLHWAGYHEGFVVMINTPCDPEHYSKAICLTDEWCDASTNFLFGQEPDSLPTILSSTKDSKAQLYYFGTGLQRVNDPFSWKMLTIHEKESAIKASWVEQKEIIALLKNQMNDLLNRNSSNNSYRNVGEQVNKETLPSNGIEKYSLISNKFEKIKLLIDSIQSELNKRSDISENLRDFKEAKGNIIVRKKTFVKNAEISGEINGMLVKDLLHDTFRLDRIKKIGGKKSVSTLKVDKLAFNKINNIDANNLVYNDRPIIINGNLTFKNDLRVKGNVVLHKTGKVNGIDLSEEVIEFGKEYKGTLNFSSLEINNLRVKVFNEKDLSSTFENNSTSEYTWKKVSVGENFSVHRLNDQNWTQVNESIVWLNEATKINGTTNVKGKISLNGDLFYDTMLLQPEPSYRNRKTVNNGITDIFNESNQTKSERDSDQLPNINYTTLKKDVLIKGDAVIYGLLRTKMENKDYWVKFAKDIVLKTELEPILMTGEKKFNNGLKIQSGLNINGSLNNHNTSNFFTTDTNQVIKGDIKFHEKVIIDEFTLNGTWNGVEVNDIVTGLKTKSHNKILPSRSLRQDYHSNTNYDNLKGLNKTDSQGQSVGLNNLTAVNLKIIGNLTIDGLVNGINLDRYKQIKSIQDSNIINEEVTVHKANCNGTFKINSLNNFVVKQKNLTSCKKSISASEIDLIKIQEMVVFGNVKTESGISGYNITEINNVAIGLERENSVVGQMIFMDEIECQSLIVGGYVNNNKLDLTIVYRDVVKKSDKNIVITGKKTFMKKLIVEDGLQVKSINKIDFYNILTTTGNHTIQGKINVKGKASIPNDEFQIKGKLNGMKISDLKSRYEQLGENAHKWNGDVIFKTPIVVRNLSATGLVNEKNFTNFVKNLVFLFDLDKEIIFTGAKAFVNNVTIVGNVKVDNNFNDMDINKFFAEAVYTNKPATIKNLAIFENKVIFHGSLLIDHDINVTTLYDVDLNELFMNAIYLNQSENGYITGSMVFKNASSGGDVTVKSLLNDIDLNDVIHLNKTQTILHSLQFVKITVLNDVAVDGRVNGLNLQTEFENTLLTEGNQTITSRFILNEDTTVKGNLEIPNIVNGKLLKTVATLQGNNVFSGSYVFEDLVLLNSLKIRSNKISGIDMKDWQNRSVLLDSNQTITGTWNVDGNIEFTKLDGNGNLNDVNVFNIKKGMNLWKSEQIELQSIIKKNYSDKCQELNSVVEKAKNQLYELQNFEIIHNLSFQSAVESIYLIKVQNDSYMVVSCEKCKLLVYKWDKTKNIFDVFFTPNALGSIEDMFTIDYRGITFIITRFSKHKNEDECSNKTGDVLWKISLRNLQFHYIQKIDNLGVVLKSNDRNGSFYSQIGRAVYKWKIYEDEIGNFELRKSLHVQDVHNDVTSIRELVTKLNSELDFQLLIKVKANNDTIVTEYSVHPKTKYVAVAAIDHPKMESKTDIIKIYKPSGDLYDKILTLKPHSLRWLEISGQNWISFIQNGTTLQIYHQEDENSSFVNRLSVEIPSTYLLTASLEIEEKLNRLPLIILKSANSTLIHVIKGNIAGDPYNGPSPDCATMKGLS